MALKSKREADEKASDDDCVIYRYGSFCTGIEVFGKMPFNLPSRRNQTLSSQPTITLSLYSEGIERVDIVQLDNTVMATPEKDKNVLDITVTCQGR